MAADGDITAARQLMRQPEALPHLRALLRRPELLPTVREALWSEWERHPQPEILSGLAAHFPATPRLQTLACLELQLRVPEHLVLELLRSQHPRARQELLRHPAELAALVFHAEAPDEAVELAEQAGARPEDPVDRAAFLLLVDRLEDFDPDHSLLRRAYDRADGRLRHRLRAALRRQGSPELTWAVLHQPASPRTEADWKGLLHSLLHDQDRQRLGRFVREAPAWWSQIALRAMDRRGWLVDDPLLQRLRQLPRQRRRQTLAGLSQSRLLPAEGPLQLSPSGALWACEGPDDMVQVGEQTLLPGHGPVTVSVAGRTGEFWEVTLRGTQALAFDPSETRLATGGADADVVVWEIASGLQLDRVRCYDGPSWRREEFAFRELAFDPGGQKLLIATSQTALLLPVGSGELQTLLEERGGRLAFSPDCARLAHGRHGMLEVLEVAGGQTRRPMPLQETWFSEQMVFSPDSQRLAVSLGSYQAVHACCLFWCQSQGGWRPIELERGQGPPIRELKFSLDGRLLGARVEDRITIWDLDLDRRRLELEGLGFSFGPDWIAVWTESELRCCCPRTGRLLGTAPYAVEGQLLETRLLPDGRLVALQRRQEGTRFWRTLTSLRFFTTGRPMGVMQPRDLAELRNLPRTPTIAYIQTTLEDRFRAEVELGESPRQANDIEL